MTLPFGRQQDAHGKRGAADDLRTDEYLSPDGRHIALDMIFHVAYRGGPGILALQVTTDPFVASEPTEINNVRRAFLSNYAVSADGQRLLLLLLMPEEIDAPAVSMVLNWYEELKRRVPPGS